MSLEVCNCARSLQVLLAFLRLFTGYCVGFGIRSNVTIWTKRVQDNVTYGNGHFRSNSKWKYRFKDLICLVSNWNNIEPGP
jgi:hypothetical protein